MQLTFHLADFYPSTTSFNYTDNIIDSTTDTMTIGSTTQNRGTLSSRTLHVQEHKRNWKPRKHQRNDKLKWMKQNNQSRSVGWRFGDKQRMEAM